MEKTVVTTSDAPAPAYTFSQGLKIGNLFQVSGQGPSDPKTGEYVALGDVKGQTLRVLENIKAILEAGGATLEDAAMLRVYLTKREDFAPMNEVYAAFMKENVPGGKLPCRTTVFVGLPHEDMLIEVDALAVVN